MRELSDDIFIAEKNLKQAQETLIRLSKTAPLKKQYRWVWVGFWLYQWMRYGYFLVSGLFLAATKKKARQFEFIKQYWTGFFILKGIRYYTTSPMPEKPEKPMLIFTLRRNYFGSLFTQTLFPFPVIVPVEKAFKEFRIKPKLASAFVGKLTGLATYSDDTLNNNIDSVKQLLKKGYSVVVHINDGFSNPSNTLSGPFFTQQLSELMREDADMYFLNLEGWERFPFATPVTPIQLRCHWVSKEDLFYLIPMDNSEKLFERIAVFFGFRQSTSVT